MAEKLEFKILGLNNLTTKGLLESTLYVRSDTLAFDVLSGRIKINNSLVWEAYHAKHEQEKTLNEYFRKYYN